MKQLRTSLLLCFIFIVLITGFRAFAYTGHPESDLGDLRNWSPVEGCVTLDGDWDFFWGKLLTYEDLQGVQNAKTVAVPASWTEYEFNNSRLTPEGFATYRLSIKTGLKSKTSLGLYIAGIPAAYRVYIDGTMVACSGTVSSRGEEMLVKSYPQIALFDIPDSEFDIIIQASNHKTMRSGLTTSLILGSGDEIEALYRKSILKSSILYGSLFLVIALSIIMAIVCRDIKYFFFLAIVCVAIFFAVDLTGINLVSRFLPRFDISDAKVLFYSSFTWGVLFLTSYFYFQFKSRFYKHVLMLALFLSVIWQLLIICVPLKLFEAIVYPGNRVNLIVAYAITMSLLNMAGIIKGTRDSFISGMEQLLCASLLTFSALLDYSYYKGISSAMPFPVLHYALIIILAVQIIIQAKQVRGLIEQQRNDELRFVQAQVKPHLLYSVIDTYIETSQQDNDKARVILESFASYLRKTFDIKKSYRYFSLREAISLVQSYISIEQIRLKNSLEVNYILPENLDVAIPTCMLQPIVENSVVHGLSTREQGGRIDIEIKQRGAYLYFSVRDNGTGMTPKEISDALAPGKNNSLSNISERLGFFNRRYFSIVSNPDNGTEVSWRVRVKEFKD
ncbi:MAG: histidine kinase [Clostridiales bacterium]|nr:histidine kinase [Clostridiales bacterium]